MSTESRDPELDHLAETLASLVPITRPVDRDRLLFRAGQLSALRKNRLWAGSSAVLATTTIVLAILLVQRPEPRVESRLVYVPAQTPDARVTDSAPSAEDERPVPSDIVARENGAPNCYQLERFMLRWGADAWPDRPAVAELPVQERPQSAWWSDRSSGKTHWPVRTP
jgi:hypothetical protein